MPCAIFCFLYNGIIWRTMNDATSYYQLLTVNTINKEKTDETGSVIIKNYYFKND